MAGSLLYGRTVNARQAFPETLPSRHDLPEAAPSRRVRAYRIGALRRALA